MRLPTELMFVFGRELDQGRWAPVDWLSLFWFVALCYFHRLKLKFGGHGCLCLLISCSTDSSPGPWRI